MQGPTKPPADQQNLLLFLSAHLLSYFIVNSGKILPEMWDFGLSFRKTGKSMLLMLIRSMALYR